MLVSRVFWASALCAVLLGAGACAEALHIDPPGAGGSASTASTGGGGGQTPCRSNVDCPPVQPVCDTLNRVCTECLEVAHCAHKPGTVCGFGECVCVTDGQSWCPPAECVDLQTSSAHCGSCGHACFGACNAGQCVDPWEPVTTQGAPSPRGRHVAIWFGDDASGAMVVWGGSPDDSTGLATGGVFRPPTKSAPASWTPTSPVGAPFPRMQATAVWTGAYMIVWGGRTGSTYYGDGARYDPATNTWSPMATANAPSARVNHTAVWDGTRMLVFGGSDSAGDELNTGGRYDPMTDTWQPMAAAPSYRQLHSAVWNDVNELLWIYGGYGDAGANGNVYLPAGSEPGGRSYNPVTDVWDQLNVAGEPSARAQHTAVWDGSRMIVFGGTDNSGDLSSGFKLEGNSWNTLTGSGPSARRDHTAVWAASKMVVFGGRAEGTLLADGAVYDSAAGAWSAAVPIAIEPRASHTAVSTGGRMIVWGGYGPGGALQTGGIYKP
jgi:hypothetical protein